MKLILPVKINHRFRSLLLLLLFFGSITFAAFVLIVVFVVALTMAFVLALVAAAFISLAFVVFVVYFCCLSVPWELKLKIKSLAFSY